MLDLEDHILELKTELYLTNKKAKTKAAQHTQPKTEDAKHAQASMESTEVDIVSYSVEKTKDNQITAEQNKAITEKESKITEEQGPLG